MLLSGWARAVGLRVAVVRAPDATPLVREATARLGVGLLAAGFDPIEVDADGHVDARRAIEVAGEAAGAFATMSLWPVPHSAAVDVWIADATTRETTVRRIAVVVRNRPAASRAIAVRAIELLRDGLVDRLNGVSSGADGARGYESHR